MLSIFYVKSFSLILIVGSIITLYCTNEKKTSLREIKRLF